MSTLKNKTPIDRVKTIFLYLSIILISIFLSYGLHSVFMTFKPAFISRSWVYIFNVVWLELPALLLLILACALLVLIIIEFVRSYKEVSHKIGNYKQIKTTEGYQNANEYLKEVFDNSRLKKYRVKQWLFILYLQNKLNLFKQDVTINQIPLSQPLLAKFYDYIDDYQEVIPRALGWYFIPFILNCFIVNSGMNGGFFNFVNGINLIFLLITVGAIILLYKTIPYALINREHIKGFYMKRKYPDAYQYIYYNDLDCPALESEIQALDYFCILNGCLIKQKEHINRDKNKWGVKHRYGRNEVFPISTAVKMEDGTVRTVCKDSITLEEFKESKRYEKNKETHSTHPDSSVLKDNKTIRKQYYYYSGFTFLLALIILLIIIPFRLYSSTHLLKEKGANEQYSNALGLYNQKLAIAQNAPDSVIVKVRRDMSDYNSIGQDWYFENTFDNNDLDGERYYSLDELENRKIKVTSYIVEEDDTWDDESYRTDYIKFSKNDLLSNDSSLTWTKPQVVKENGKRSTTRYAIWETDYTVSLKPRILPRKPQKPESGTIDVSTDDLVDNVMSTPVTLPSVEMIPQIFNNFISMFK